MPAHPNETAGLGPAIEIRSGAVNLPILKLLTDDVGAVALQLRERIRQSPDFFRQAPMAIDLSELDPRANIDFFALAQAMRDLGLIPVGICGGVDRQVQAAQEADLSRLTLARHESAHAQAAPARPVAPAKARPKQEEVRTKLVELPVRSGQRIYAAGGDLVVLSQVSPGAEIMADGNIHIYGVLRGRALAGVQGNLSSRIFCHDLQAELVAVGGHYKISENIDDSLRGVPVQIYLKDNSLIIEKT